MEGDASHICRIKLRTDEALTLQGVIVEPDIRATPGAEYPPGPSFLPRLLSGRLFRGGTINMLRENAQRYGDIVHYRAINRKIYQINHPDLIQELLINDEPRNHRHMVMQRSRFILGTGLLTSEEPLHMRQRRMAAPAFHRHRIAAYGDVIAKYSAEMIEHWRPGPLNAYPEMMTLALRIVSKCLFDTDARSEAKKIGDAVDAFMGFLPLAFLPLSKHIERLPFGPMKKIRKGGADVDAIIYGIIAERRRSPGDRGDLLSMLLEATDVEDDPGGAPHGPATGMTDKQLRDECLTVMLAGHETTCNGLSFALWMLAKHPEAQEELHQEAVRVLGDRPPDATDFPRLRYAYMVFAEALRMFPPVWVIGRTCGPEGYDFQGFRISPGSIMIAPQVVVHHDSRFWPEPDRFDPLRFAEEEKATRPRFAYYPFGAGSRQCIGEGLAWMEGVFSLATIFRHWRVRPAPGSPEQLPMSPMISLRPKGGVPLVLERR